MSRLLVTSILTCVMFSLWFFTGCGGGDHSTPGDYMRQTSVETKMSPTATGVIVDVIITSVKAVAAADIVVSYDAEVMTVDTQALPREVNSFYLRTKPDDNTLRMCLVASEGKRFSQDILVSIPFKSNPAIAPSSVRITGLLYDGNGNSIDLPANSTDD